jgi:hypothetical protein
MQPLSLESLPKRPKVSSVTLIEMLNDFDRTFNYFNDELQSLLSLNQMTARTAGEQALVFVGPFLLAVALALRITKVTGEIKLES